MLSLLAISAFSWHYIDKPLKSKKNRKKTKSQQVHRKLNFKVEPCDEHKEETENEKEMDDEEEDDEDDEEEEESRPAKSKTDKPKKKSKKKEKVGEGSCKLYVRIFPLIYYNLSRNLEFKLGFTSDCFESTLFFYSMLPWQNQPILHAHDHPSFVRLNILQRVFDFKFHDPFRRGKDPFVTIAYKHVEIYPTNFKAMINTFGLNNVKLDPSESSEPFTVEDINKLKIVDNPGSCDLIDDMKILNCVMTFQA